MTRKGGINKTRKAVAKRFKVTGTGKVLRRKQGKRHILQTVSYTHLTLPTIYSV